MIGKSIEIMKNKIELLEEDIECLHLNLDAEKIPRYDENGERYSMWGRVQLLLERNRSTFGNALGQQICKSAATT